MINRQLVNNNTKCGVVQSSEMLSSDYLATIDQQFNGATNDIQDEPIDLTKDLLNYMESEWDNLEGYDYFIDVVVIAARCCENRRTRSWGEPHYQLRNGPHRRNGPRNGDLLNAILHFESVIHENPSNSQAWYMLGLCQAENERDLQAIAAFKKSIQIDPKNAEAILALSVSYANESMPNESLRLLDEWLSVHPIYGHDNADRISISNTKSYSLDENHFKKVEERFMKAVQKQSESVDVQLQNALSILYNLNENYQRAIDSLNIALSIEPDVSYCYCHYYYYWYYYYYYYYYYYLSLLHSTKLVDVIVK
ncbi:unnamed protein product [Anisakis simplex]|uniref:Peroxisomal targeting signal 1 receptor (inferred by orthology to a human protein) n=1 Tax=Anisakis simplex TaxID=6269 RepID=A0A0M3J5P6_ANISI|nr:unnamed protein product [Anisakis simplex]